MALIVTAEDDDRIRAVVARSLQRAGHTVIATGDGVEALSAVREHRPDVVVTDGQMPRMGGIELCRAVRADPQLRYIPVVLVSGSIDLYDGLTVEAGITAVLGKPFTPDELRRQLDEVLPHPT